METYVCDLCNTAELDKCCQTLAERNIDILVNNAGIFGPKVRQGKGLGDGRAWPALHHFQCYA